MIIIIIMLCRKCNYSWRTKSKLTYVSCPNCGTKNKLFHMNVPKAIKEELYRIRKNKCELCKSKENLRVHHIIPKSFKTLNHKLENLKLVCQDCHVKIHKGELQ